MSLVFGAITPHPPLLLPSLGRDKTAQLENTARAFQDLEGSLYSVKPDTLIIISPHAPIAAEAFYINLAQKYHTDLQEFGDMSTQLNFHGDIELASKLRAALHNSSIHVNLTHQPTLDYGSLVPLFFLTRHIPDVKIIPISYSLLDYETHFEFGRILQQEILNASKRVAVIASGDLSHRLTENAPAGYSPKAAELDEAIMHALQNKNHKALIQLDPILVKEGNECGLRSFIILLGIFNTVNYTVTTLSYEHPFGIGYLVASLNPQ